MQAVQSEEVEAYQFATHRQGDIKFQRLLQGDPDAPNNFEWSIVRVGEDYMTPRHHHNFSQIHLVLEGTHEWAPDETIPTGAVGYFGEGTFYGPQQGHGGLLLGLQYGEASGSGFMSYDRLAEGNKRLAREPERGVRGRRVPLRRRRRQAAQPGRIRGDLGGDPRSTRHLPDAPVRARDRHAPRRVRVGARRRRARRVAQAPGDVHRASRRPSRSRATTRMPSTACAADGHPSCTSCSTARCAAATGSTAGGPRSSSIPATTRRSKPSSRRRRTSSASPIFD